MNPPVVNELDRALLPIVKCTVPKNNTKSGGSKKSAKKSPLQQAGAKFVDELGRAGITRLKEKLGLNTELHCLDVASGVAVLATTLAQLQGAITVPQGATDTTRVGDSIRIVSWEQFLIASTQATTATPTIVRFIGVANRHNAPATTPTTILKDTTDVMSPLHPQFSQSGLELVFDKSIVLGAGSAQSDGCQLFEKHWRPSDFHMIWTQGDTTGVQADLVAGGTYVFGMYNATAGAAVAAPKYSITSRLTFVDN